MTEPVDVDRSVAYMCAYLAERAATPEDEEGDE